MLNIMNIEPHTLTTSKTEHGPKIMVVDDDFASRLTVKLTLENSGFTVIEGEDGHVALECFTQQNPDLILLDVIMPGIDGFETCRKLRKLPGGRHVPIIMVTSLEDIQTIDASFEAGATDFIAKPINLNILSHRTRYWLRSGAILNDLNISQKRLAKAQQLAKLGHWELDLENNQFQFSTEVAELFGITDVSTYESLFENIVPSEKAQVKNLVDAALKSRKHFTVNYKIFHQDGDERTIFNQGETVYGDDTGKPRLVGIVQDITQLKKAEEKIRYLAFYDHLTGLANRALLKEHWLKIKPQTLRNNEKIAVLFIDLDHFKRVNDTLGHSMGDQLLVVIANRLKKELRVSDIILRTDSAASTALVSRVGGDEFIILASHIKNLDDISNIAERIILTMERPVLLENHEISISASMGISVFPDDSKNIETLFRNADTAMYEAKDSGRNRFKFYQTKMNDAAQARFELGNSLRKALVHNEFTLFYQPQYCNDSKTLIGVEALIRWQHPTRGLLLPKEFLPFAEESGLIYRINSWVLREACSQAYKWVCLGFLQNCRMAINISGQKIDFNELVDEIFKVLHDTALEPRYLELELTERVMMEDTEEAISALGKLKEAGVTIAIDDFGTGYSALSHLRVFPLSKLKIDKSFVSNINSSKKDASLLSSIIAIAKSFDLTVIAEGVETEKQRQALDEMGCDELQGFLLNTPLPVEKLEKTVLQVARDT